MFIGSISDRRIKGDSVYCEKLEFWDDVIADKDFSNFGLGC